MTEQAGSGGLQALIWDVDGTLAETERDGHRVAFNLAFEQLGIPWRWSEARYGELLRITGGRERLLHDMAQQREAPAGATAKAELAARLHSLKNAAYADIVAQRKIALRPGVAELMADCRRAGLTMAIATTTSRSNVQALLAAQCGEHWEADFACVLCAEDAPVKKPDPQVYRLALQRLALPAHAVLAVEDSSPGVAAAHAAAIAVVVTRSVYFADIAVPDALAAGPGLHSVRGWSGAGPAALSQVGADAGGDDGRIDLSRLRRWHAAIVAPQINELSRRQATGLSEPLRR